ncbi:MAG: hypothetical protein PHF00_11705 [Elusimicrobia bacterium]|nr:hypothetical protein [Elusimicrobiota bacterium]
MPAYYSLLAALDDSGFDVDIVSFDFVRGIIQLNQYEEMAAGYEGATSGRKLESVVAERSSALAGAMELTAWERLRIGWRLYSLPELIRRAAGKS